MVSFSQSVLFRKILFCIFLHLSIWLKNVKGQIEPPSTVDPNSYLFSAEARLRLTTYWNTNANETHDPTREKVVLRLLNQNSGIYTSKTKAKKNGVERTVLLTVISMNDGASMHMYKQMLRNWMCYTAHYDYMPIVYYLTDTSSTNQSEIMKHKVHVRAYLKELQEINENILFIDYPTQLFWSLLSAKTKWDSLKTDRNVVDFCGSIPSFSHFGALVMLIPILEVLELGYNVIYLDVDIALVKDPVPFIALGHSDFNVSPETRQCSYNTRIEDTRKSYTPKRVEPNTGLMLIRATQLGSKLFRAFLVRLVEENKANDQPHLTQSLGFTHSMDCHYNFSKTLQKNIDKEGLLNPKLLNVTESPPATLCVMQDILFQNGYMAFSCSERERDKPKYMLMMNRMGRLGSPMGTSTDPKYFDPRTNYSDCNSASLYSNSSNSSDGARYHRLLQGTHSDSGHSREGSRKDKIHSGHGAKSHANGKQGKSGFAKHHSSTGHHLATPGCHGNTMQDIDVGNDLDFSAPLTVHANYCGTKHRCFSDRGLWLLESYSALEPVPFTSNSTAGARAVPASKVTKFRCKAYNKADTKFSKGMWIYDLDAAENHLGGSIKDFSVGSAVNNHRNYIVDYPIEGTTRKNEDKQSGRASADFVKSPRTSDEESHHFGELTVAQKYWTKALSWTTSSESAVRRDQAVRAGLEASRGVYSDPQKAIFYGVENTVLLFVLSYDDIMNLKDDVEELKQRAESEGTVHGSYRAMLRSHLLAMHQYGLKTVLYVAPSTREFGLDGPTVQRNVRHVLTSLSSGTEEDLGLNVHVVYSYPNVLFFSFFYALKVWYMDLLDSDRASSYMGNVPNVFTFGILIALVPILEVIAMGYDVIFIDVTVKVYSDPIPFLTSYRTYTPSADSTTSAPDFAVTKESTKRFIDCGVRTLDLVNGGDSAGAAPRRVSDIPSVNVQFRPGFSVMRFSSSEASVLFMERWIKGAVKSGDRKGRESFSLAFSTEYTESFDCNYDSPRAYPLSSAPLSSKAHRRTEQFSTRGDISAGLQRVNGTGGGEIRNSSVNGTHCYINGVRFISHRMSIECFKHSKSGKSTAVSLTSKVNSSSSPPRVYVAMLTHSDMSCSSFFDMETKESYFEK